MASAKTANSCILQREKSFTALPSGRIEPRRGEGLFLIFENRFILELTALSGAETPTLPEGEWQPSRNLFAKFLNAEYLK